MHKFAHGYWCI